MIVVKNVLLFAILITIKDINAASVTRSVTNEDIREAILSVVHMIRATEDKLERHEFRERALGEHVKKAFLMLDKRLKTLDPVKGTVSRLDERLAAVETILMQKDERERAQLVKTHDAVEDIQKNLPMIMERLKADIIESIGKSVPSGGKCSEPGGVSPAELQAVHKDLASKLDAVQRSMVAVAADLGRVKNDSKQISTSSSDSLERVKKQLTHSELLLEKYENKLAEMSNRIQPMSSDKDEKDWQSTLVQALDEQKDKVEDVSSEVKRISEQMRSLASREDVQRLENETKTESAPLAEALDTRLKEMQADQDRRNEKVTKEVTNLATLHNSLLHLLTHNHDELKSEISGLAKVEQVMVQTADSVLDIKRRVEYGVHQILLEVGGLVKGHAKSINATINDRFDNFEMNVLDGDSGALANLTSKIGQEIDQVWRQIGIMHQQMSANADTLNHLQNQTDHYVSGSLSVMDGVQGKVGQITGRMTDLDENLNYLMGKLALVTQQFNQIKGGLGRALDEMRASLATVKDKMPEEKPSENIGPGPHKISPPHQDELEDNAINDAAVLAERR